ncbi:hypothetical protein [Algoriphagus persicinus]|uniref:hypothetical protein n=1 Tax=Algoriphagus persicinus TaxID=3108754 RepID=UPI002B39EEB6|nr:hypothetical protein [Algoriphagus sp. E1-3-M2]MEB2784935.1 hypothetical protein [Algoriphagus sp. E1-3-M2]
MMLLISASYAQKPEIFSENSKAIKGYDPVAYFPKSNPVMGKEEFKFIHESVNGLDG